MYVKCKKDPPPLTLVIEALIFSAFLFWNFFTHSSPAGIILLLVNLKLSFSRNEFKGLYFILSQMFYLDGDFCEGWYQWLFHEFFFLINKLLKYFYRFKITQIVYGVSGNYVLNYLGTRPNLATYVSQSLIQVIKFR